MIEGKVFCDKCPLVDICDVMKQTESVYHYSGYNTAQTIVSSSDCPLVKVLRKK